MSAVRSASDDWLTRAWGAFAAHTAAKWHAANAPEPQAVLDERHRAWLREELTVAESAIAQHTQAIVVWREMATALRRDLAALEARP